MCLLLFPYLVVKLQDQNADTCPILKIRLEHSEKDANDFLIGVQVLKLKNHYK